MFTDIATKQYKKLNNTYECDKLFKKEKETLKSTINEIKY